MTLPPREPSFITPQQRAMLAHDHTLGCGSFFQRVLELSEHLDDPHIWLDRPFVFQGEPRTELSLRTLARIVDHLAGWYHARGIRPVDAVVVYVDNGIDYFMHYLALMRLGALPVLVNGNLDGPTVQAFTRRVGAVGMVTDDTRHDGVAAVGEHLRFLVRRHELVQGPALPLPRRYPFAHPSDHPVLLTHSSGTTGVPKAVLHQHHRFFQMLRYRQQMPHKRGMSRILTALPCAHNSAITQLSYALLNGLPIMVMSSQTGADVLRAIAAFGATMVTSFPMTYVQMCDEGLDRYDLSTVSLWYNSGDAAHEKHVRQLVARGHHYAASRKGGAERRPGSHFVDGLGSSEMGHSLFHVVHGPDTANFGRCIGKPVSLVEAVVLGPDGEFLDDYEVGRLGVKAPTLTTSYWNDSVLTWSFREGEYWVTGDLVYRDEEGRFFHMDRITDAVHTPAGVLYTCQAEELLLRRLPDLADCTIVGVGPASASPWAFVRPERQAPPREAAAWKAELDQILAEANMPGVEVVRVVRDEDLPIGVTGKVKKRELRDRCNRELAGAGRSTP
jgi:acyl-coenzyme A synthetase/AMP-(fatty) acid ligase